MAQFNRGGKNLYFEGYMIREGNNDYGVVKTVSLPVHVLIAHSDKMALICKSK